MALPSPCFYSLTLSIIYSTPLPMHLQPYPLDHLQHSPPHASTALPSRSSIALPSPCFYSPTLSIIYNTPLPMFLQLYPLDHLEHALALPSPCTQLSTALRFLPKHSIIRALDHPRPMNLIIHALHLVSSPATPSKNRFRFLGGVAGDETTLHSPCTRPFDPRKVLDPSRRLALDYPQPFPTRALHPSLPTLL